MQRSAVIGLIIAAILLLLWRGDFFAGARLRLNDVYFVPFPATDTTRLIAIDDPSFAAYGRSLTDWSRTVFADLMPILEGAGARVVTFDVIFRESSREDAFFASAIRNARRSEARLRTILPVVGAQPDRTEGAQLLRYLDASPPPNVLLNAIEGVGYINVQPDVDNTIRRQVSRVQVGDEIGYSLAIVTYLAYLRISPSAYDLLITSEPNILRLTPERSIPVNEDGLWMPNYFRSPLVSSETDAYPTYSLRAVLEGEVDPEVFRDKIVLVGEMNAVGITDVHSVPTAPGDRLMAGVELHAHAVETLLQDRALYPQSQASQALMIVLLTVIASMIYGQLRWFLMLPAGLTFIALWMLFAFFSFSLNRVVIDLYYSLLALGLPIVATLLADFESETLQRRKSEFLLRSVVEVSGQKMELERILAQVVKDIQRLVRTEAGAVWLHDESRGVLEPVSQWHFTQKYDLAACMFVAHSACQQQRTIVNGGHVAIPVLWQRRVLAVFTARIPPGSRVNQSALGMLELLAVQIAPSIENALLFAETTRQKALLEAIIAESPAGLLVLDDQLNVIKANLAADEMLDIECGERVGAHISALLTSADLETQTVKRLEAQFGMWKPFREQINHRNRTLIMDAAALEGIREWVILLSDVTPLAQLSEIKTQMIRMASHDLNNPLTNVIVTSQMLLDKRFGAQMSDAVRMSIERMQRSSHLMRQIIEDILNLERVRSQVLFRTSFNLGEVLQEVCDSLAAEADRKAQTLTAVIEPDLPPINGDQAQIRQAMLNLIGNAIKYTPDGGVVNVTLGTDVDRLLVEVEDNGYGIPESEHKKIFQEFFRAKSGAASSIPGTGLGLSLVKSVVTAHGGRVWFRSIEDEGSTFFVELPCAPEAEPAP